MPEPSTPRKRGRRPEDAQQRRARVNAALEVLEATGVPFSMADLAERAGISRATLYRDSTLRDLVGRRGEGPAHRPVDFRDYQRCVAERAKAIAAQTEAKRELRAALRETAALRERIDRLAREMEARQQSQLIDAQIQGDVDRIRTEAYAEGFQAGSRAASQRLPGARAGGPTGLATVAARLPRPAVAGARRTLAKALHPDLYADNPAAAMLATEILKQLNSLAGP